MPLDIFELIKLLKTKLNPKSVSIIFCEKQAANGQIIADKIADSVGSWRFIILQATILSTWILLNVANFLRQWDPYPFVLLNLLVGVEASFAASIILISQNREARQHSEVNERTEQEVREILSHLETQDKALSEILERINKL
jgi:uncharacterized membrane protein